jgi:Protein of unknown function (DUF2802)
MLADLILATGVLLLGVLASYQTRGLLRVQQLLAKESAQRLALEQELRALLECSRSLGSRVHQQNAQHLALSAELHSIARRPESAAQIVDAQRLLKEGLEVDKVASLCELSQGEAALLARWCAQRAAA